MITDEMIAQAVVAYGEAMANSLPDPKDCDCTFSAAFQRKMRRLIRRVDHPVRYQVLRSAAAVLLFLLVGFGTVIAVSPTARTAVIGWLRDTFSSGWVSYEYHGSETAGSPDADYYIAALPEEYELESSVQHSSNQHTKTYHTPNGERLCFSWVQAGKGNEMFVSTTNTQEISATVNGQKAALYITDNPTSGNSVVWQDSENSLIFIITSPDSGDELIRLAESVTAR